MRTPDVKALRWVIDGIVACPWQWRAFAALGSRAVTAKFAAPYASADKALIARLGYPADAPYRPASRLFQMGQLVQSAVAVRIGALERGPCLPAFPNGVQVLKTLIQGCRVDGKL